MSTADDTRCGDIQHRREESRGGCPGAPSLLVLAPQAGRPPERFRPAVRLDSYRGAMTLDDTETRTCEALLKSSSTLSRAPVLSAPVTASTAYPVATPVLAVIAGITGGPVTSVPPPWPETVSTRSRALGRSDTRAVATSWRIGRTGLAVAAVSAPTVGVSAPATTGTTRCAPGVACFSPRDTPAPS